MKKAFCITTALSTLISLFCSLNTIAQNDTIWLKDGSVISSKIISRNPENGNLSIDKVGKNQIVDIAAIHKFSWNDVRYSGDLDWKTLDCNGFPFISLDKEGQPSFTKKLDYGSYDSGDVYWAFKRIIQNEWGTASGKRNFEIDESEKRISFSLSERRDIQNEFAPSSSLAFKLACQLKFNPENIEWTINIQEIWSYAGYEDPKTLLVEKYMKPNGKARQFNFEACEQLNNAISELSLEVSNILIKSKSKAQISEDLRDFRERFVKHLNSGKALPLEGIWSVDVAMPQTGNLFAQAYEVAIHRYGEDFVIAPLTSEFPDFDMSYKILVKTAEPTVFLLSAYFPEFDYTSNGRFILESSALASFTLQIPDKGLMQYCAVNDLKYVGDRSVNYSLVKTVSGAESPEAKSNKWTGTGFAVSSNGLLATNYHVVEGGTSIHVRGLNGNGDQKVKVEVVCTDQKADLAILKISDQNINLASAVPYNLKESDSKQGTSVYSLGFPKPGVFDEQLIATDGIISATKGTFGNVNNYQMTVPITNGNSGGPIFDKDGQVVGISVAGYMATELMLATFSVKSSQLIKLLGTIPGYVPVKSQVVELPLEEQIERYKEFIYLIEVSSE